MSTLSERGVRDVGPQPVRPPEAKSSIGTAASGGTVFQKKEVASDQSGEEEYRQHGDRGADRSCGSTTAHGTPDSRKLIASAFCAAHTSASDLPAALRERLGLSAAPHFGGRQEQLCKTRQQ